MIHGEEADKSRLDLRCTFREILYPPFFFHFLSNAYNYNACREVIIPKLIGGVCLSVPRIARARYVYEVSLTILIQCRAAAGFKRNFITGIISIRELLIFQTARVVY